MTESSPAVNPSVPAAVRSGLPPQAMAVRRALAFEARPVASASRAGSRLFGVPHRFFFLVGVVQIAATALWWAWTLAARAWPAVLPRLRFRQRRCTRC
jgi:hypothetical protein